MAGNFDENQQDSGIEGGWRAIHKFMNRNRQFFESSHMPVFTPGLGKEGPSNFMDMVYSVPVLFVVDRQGERVAPPPPTPAQAPAPTPAPAPAPPAEPSKSTQSWPRESRYSVRRA